MKIYGLISFLILFSLIGKSQEYSFPLYFEDSAGNKDTIFFGFDQSASFGIDENLGELNTLGQPYDSTFFAFFTDAVSKEEWDCRLENEKTSTYITKKQYVNLRDNPFIEIGLNVRNWPVKISWNQGLISDFGIDHYLESEDLGLVITSFHPFNAYPDAFCCGSWPTPTGLTWLSEAADIQIEKNNCCLYKANFSKDSISLIYVGQMYKYTSIKDFQTKMYRCWYNESLKSLCIQNTNGSISSKVEVFNAWGLKVIDKLIFPDNETQLNINISHLPNGLYLIRISPFKSNYLNSTFKIIKR